MTSGGYCLGDGLQLSLRMIREIGWELWTLLPGVVKDQVIPGVVAQSQESDLTFQGVSTLI